MFFFYFQNEEKQSQQIAILRTSFGIIYTIFLSGYAYFFSNFDIYEIKFLGSLFLPGKFTNHCRMFFRRNIFSQYFRCFFFFFHHHHHHHHSIHAPKKQNFVTKNFLYILFYRQTNKTHLLVYFLNFVWQNTSYRLISFRFSRSFSFSSD